MGSAIRSGRPSVRRRAISTTRTCAGSPTNVGRANEILDSLGWVDTNGDGIREDKAGNTIEFTLITNGGNSVRGAVTQRVADGMSEIGVKANYTSVEFGDLVTRLTASYAWEAMVVGFTGGTDPYGGISLLAQQRVLPPLVP